MSAATVAADVGPCAAIGRDQVHCADALVRRRNPADTADILGPTSAASAQIVALSVDAAVHAAVSWAGTSTLVRGAFLRLVAERLRASADAIGATLTRETGKPLAEAVAEVNGAAAIFDYFASADGWYDEGRVASTRRPGKRLLLTRREPLGPVSVITPWNFPISNPALKIAAAVAAGNSVVWKPSQWASGTAFALWQAFVDAGAPDGLLSIVLGEGDVGEALVGDNRIRAVSFTGSTRVGRLVGRQAAERGIPAQLELGGKNAAIVLADADLARAAADVASGAFGYSGQKCTATSRVIVDRSVAEAFTARLIAAVSCMPLGDPAVPETVIGPIVDRRQLDSHVKYVELAREAGAEILIGGHTTSGPSGRGLYLEPTVIRGLPSEHAVAREEIFGPVLVLFEVAGLDEAIAAANDSDYGLSTSVFTASLASAMTAVERLECGVVKVNEPSPGLETHIPVGGWKASGTGHPELGPTALDFFTRSKTAVISF